jgi:hypothetical protein
VTTEFERDGFALIRDPAIAEIKHRLRMGLCETISSVIRKHPGLGMNEADIDGMDFVEAFTSCHASGRSPELSRALFEVFISSLEMVRLVTEPFYVELARKHLVKRPAPSTMPVVRFDRPGESKFLTPVHQDYWYSMLSPNSLTLWFGGVPLTRAMGLLEVIPGTHRLGLLPTRPFSVENPFTTAESFSDDRFVPVEVPDDAVLVFNQMLVHRSTPNLSDRVRFSIQVRYNDLETLSEPTSSFTSKWSRHVLAAQAKNLREEVGEVS